MGTEAKGLGAVIRTFRYKDERRVQATRYDVDRVGEILAFTGGSIEILPDLSFELHVNGQIYGGNKYAWIVKEGSRISILSDTQMNDRFE
jgi:hypothetical protein